MNLDKNDENMAPAELDMFINDTMMARFSSDSKLNTDSGIGFMRKYMTLLLDRIQRELIMVIEEGIEDFEGNEAWYHEPK